MAELDDKLLKNLDKTLESMNERLLTLETTLSGVKNGLNKTFDPSIITSFADAIRGLKMLRLIDAEGATKDIQKVKDKIDELEAKWKGDKPLGKGESFAGIADELARYKALMKDIQKGSEQRTVELANAAKKEADAVLAEERRKQKAFQDSVKQQEELARKYAELEKLRSEVFGGRSYGKLSGKEKVQWTEMGSSLEKIKKQMEEIEKLSPGSRAKGESIYKEQEAITRAKREAAEEQKRIAKEEAEYEKLLRQEQIQEERRKAAETKRLAKEEADALSEYIRLYREKTGLLKTVSPLDAKVIRHQPLTEQERGLYDASWNRIYAIQDQMAKLRESYVSVLEYEEKIQANGQEQVALGKVRLTQEQALAKEKERQAKSESKQQSDEAKIQKQADAIVKKRIDLERQVQRIDNDRAIRQQTNSKISQQALDAESRKYEALLQRINQLNNALSKLEGKQAGVTSRAEQRNAPYMNYVAAAEEERKAKAIENSTKKLKEQKNALDSMLPTIQRLASAFGIAFSVRGLAQFGKKLIETRGEFELQQVALRSILQNKQLADEIWDKTMQAALQSPFTAMQLTRYTKQLAAYRIETDKLFDTTKRLADVSAGLGVDMQRLILAYGQVKAANYLRASEIRQFTEAGVNVLGELRDYFNDVKGMSVDTAKVMDMVQKRLVKFEDVEAIFQRMTDKGGIFYNMQYVQSQTVKGQINKLHDAYDQMLNSIGKANEGTLKKFVAALNSIVKNWQLWAVAIKSIGWGVAIGWISKYAFALVGVQKASVSTLRSMVKLKQGLQGIGTFFSANWPQLAAAGVAMLAAAFVNLYKKMKAANKEIDEQNLRLYETRRNFESIKSKIEENNKAIEKEAKGTEKSNNAKRENENILKKLKDEYPQLANSMKIATNGIIDMNDAIDVNIRKLNEQMTILSAMRQENMFTKSDKQILQEGEQALSSMQVRMASVQAAALSEMQKLEVAFGGKEKAEQSTLYQIYDSISKIDLDGNILQAVDALKQLNDEANKFLGGKKVTPNPLYDKLGISNFFGGLTEDLKQTQQLGEMVMSINKNQAILKKAYERGIRDNAEFSKEIAEKYGNNVSAFIVANAERVNAATIEGLNKANEILIKTLGPQTDVTKKFLNDYLNKIWGYKGVDLFSTSVNKTEGGDVTTEDKQNKVDSAWRRRIGLLEEMKKRYDELSKSAYGFAKSEEETRKAFDESFKEIFKGTNILMSQIDFTSMEGMKKSTELALSRAKGVSDAVREEIMKKIDSYEAQITIDAQVRVREDFVREIERMFNSYEITMELDNLNLPKGLANELWGVERTELLDLRAEITDMFNGLKDENGQLADDAFKKYESFLKKIDDLETKQQRDRLKDYSKYIEAQYSDRVKIEMEYVRKLAGLEAMAMPEDVKSEIRRGLERDFFEKSRKQDWEDFKGSEFYVQMMEDLEKQSTASLEVMRVKLLEMRKNAENLSPRALKEVVNALEKIDDLERSRNKPLSRLTSALKELRGYKMKDVFGSLADNQKRLSEYEEEEKGLERMIMLENERLRLEKEQISIEEAKQRLASSNDVVKAAEKALKDFRSAGSKEDVAMVQKLTENLNNAKMAAEMWQLAVEALSGESVIGSQKGNGAFSGWSLSDLKTRRDELRKQKVELQGQIDKEENLVKINKELQLAWHATWEAVKDWGSRVQSVFDVVMDSIEYFEGSTLSMTSEWKEFGDTMVSSMNDLISGIQAYQEANEAAKKADLATGLFTANGLKLLMVTLGVIIKMVQAISKIRDSRIDKEIEKSKERVEDLQKAYERLEKQIKKTFDTVSYMMEFNKETQNLYEQIEEANNQIAAAQDYKNADKRKEAIEAAEDAKQQALDALDEIKQAQLDVFGGIGEEGYRDAAQGFVDAWKSAFLETGDGLQGLQDHFDEFLNDWFTKQATMRIAANNLAPLFRKIDQAVDQYGVGGAEVTWQELQEINDLKDLLLTQTNEQLKELAGVFGIGGEGSLSGLAAGIQGMTEEQANILEAYWNSVRMYTASIDMNVARIAETLGAGGVNTNPQLQQLNLIAANTAATQTLLQSVTKSGHGLGGSGIKVFVD